MMLVQWREGQKGKNVHLTLLVMRKELGLECSSPIAFKLQLKLTPKPQLCEQIRAQPVAGRHLSLPSPDVQQVLVQPSWTGTLPEMMKSKQNPRGQ